MKSPIKITLQHKPSLTGDMIYRVKQITGAVIVYRDGNKPVRVGDALSETQAANMAMTYNITVR